MSNPGFSPRLRFRGPRAETTRVLLHFYPCPGHVLKVPGCPVVVSRPGGGPVRTQELRDQAQDILRSTNVVHHTTVVGDARDSRGFSGEGFRPSVFSSIARIGRARDQQPTRKAQDSDPKIVQRAFPFAPTLGQGNVDRELQLVIGGPSKGSGRFCRMWLTIRFPTAAVPI